MRDDHQFAPRRATLQDVLDALSEMFVAGEIDADQVREARSSVLSFCRVAGKKPRQLKANIAELLEPMDRVSGFKAGLKSRRWSNLKALLRRTLNLVGNPTKPARRDRPLSPAWHRLVGNFSDRDVRSRMRPFAGYCTDNLIAPGFVDEQVFEAYEKELRLTARSKNPTDSIKKLRRAWNKLVDAFPDELSFRAYTWTTSNQWAESIDVMPAPFQKEMKLFKAARSPETFEQHLRCRPLKNERAVQNQCGTIMRIVTVMINNGHPISNFTSFEYIVRPEFFKDTIRGLKTQTKTDDLRNLGGYVSVLHWLAEIWVGVSETDLRELKKFMTAVGHRKSELSDSSIDVLEQLEDPKKRSNIKIFAETIFLEFRAKAETATKKDAKMFRDALFFELGLVTGWRPSSRARINMNDDIIWKGRKGKEVAILVAGKALEKTELRRRVELPIATSAMLQYYIDHAQHLLCPKGKPDNPHLFPSRSRSGHTTTGQLSSRSAMLVARCTHVTGATGHKTRHIGAKLHLDEHPGDWLTVQEHLGQNDPETAKKFYTNVSQVESSKRVQKSMGKR